MCCDPASGAFRPTYLTEHLSSTIPRITIQNSRFRHLARNTIYTLQASLKKNVVNHTNVEMQIPSLLPSFFLLLLVEASPSKVQPTQPACTLYCPESQRCGAFTKEKQSCFPMCGGIAGLRCPEGTPCGTAPTVGCAFGSGAPDCSGICVARCGGFAGFPCKDPEKKCVDDPTDSCDPKHGGADCGGICIPKQQKWA